VGVSAGPIFLRSARTAESIRRLKFPEKLAWLQRPCQQPILNRHAGPAEEGSSFDFRTNNLPKARAAMIRAWLLITCCIACLIHPATVRSLAAAEAAKPAADESTKGARSDGKPAAVTPKDLLSRVTTFADLEAMAKKQTTAAAAVALYKLFLHDAKIAKAEKDLARKQLSYWENLESGDAIQVGGKWLTAAQLEERKADEKHLIAEADALIDTGNGELAEEKLIAATKANPTGVNAYFQLGLYHAMVKRNSLAAEKDFTECVKRLKRKDPLSNEDRANLVASLNNLAITEVRQKKHASAVKNWKEAAQIAPPPIEVVQNMGRFVHLARAMPILGVPKDTAKSAGNLFASIAAHAEGKSFSLRLGWLYVGVFGPEEESEADSPPKSDSPPTDRGKRKAAGKPILVGGGTGFVVQPGLIITNHHVVEGADEIQIRTPRNQAVEHTARVLALSPKLDLALLECKDLTAPPVPISTDPPRLATDVLLLGYPEFFRIGTELKTVKGTISALPDPDNNNLLLYDAAINQGNSGGPACDQHGRVVAVNDRIFILTNNLAGGIPASVLLDFLKKELPTFHPQPASATALEWPDVAEKVGESTLLVLVLKSPANLQTIANAAPKRPDNQVDIFALEDPWCMICAGTGEVDCPVRNCSRGVVPGTSNSVTGVNPVSGARIVNSSETEVRCSTCGGKGVVPCKYCAGGIDPTVLGKR
jgi:S1-C subfamily serine protease